jgi:spore coat protein U-like protein
MITQAYYLRGREMQFNRALIMAILSLGISTVDAGELGAKLNTQIELLPSCSINNKTILDGENGLKLGEINFGETTASFNGIIESSLISEAGAGIQIQCAGISALKLTFGAGQNDGNIPTAFSENYHHALSNGKDFLAYNLLYGTDKRIIKANDFFILNNTAQTQTVRVFGRAINNGSPVSMGNYHDLVPVVIEF